MNLLFLPFVLKMTLMGFILLLICGPPLTIMAQEEPDAANIKPKKPTPESKKGADAEDRDKIKPRKARTVSSTVVNQRTREYIASGTKKITVYQIVQEMIDDFIADSRELNIAAISPLSVRKVGLTPNLANSFGGWVETELINAISKHTDIRVKRCISCHALKTSLEGNQWVVKLGHVRQEDLKKEAKRLGVVTFMDAFVSYVPGANVVTLNLQVFRATDGKVLWSETYRSDATTAAILRSGDRVLTRDEARSELVRKIEQRPYYGYQVLAGAGMIPYDSPLGNISGMLVGGRIYEKFGADQRYMYGFHGEGFINIGDNGLLGAFLGATFQYQLNEPNLNDPIYRVGGVVQGFIAGTEGNSFALEAVAEAIFQFRFGASLSAFYFVPTKYATFDLGGLGFKAHAVLNW